MSKLLPTVLTGLLICTVPSFAGAQTTKKPPVTRETRDRDGFPVATTALESLIYECARASGVDPNGVMTAKQVRDTTNCIDLVRRALATTK